MSHPFAATERTGPATAWIYGEPAIDDLLQDPVVQSVLRRDGLSEDDVRSAIGRGRARLRPLPRRESRAA
ncbi:hypothetical protein [Pelagibius sp.]|uniref:hypothetical protein n=1 Tax=Pelagibius sp. TaxID=1931238 RepID=UPI00262291E1|nr:hypothetical protein [Pelagibius sp.]